MIYSYINPLQEFWENLIQGNDLIGPTRWPEGLYDLPPRIGAIHDLDKFDSVFFNISDEEVKNDKMKHLKDQNDFHASARHWLVFSITYDDTLDTSCMCTCIKHTVSSVSACCDITSDAT